jgi:hypothetical protein
MIRLFTLSFIGTLLSLSIFSQDDVTLSGYIKDAANGETLIGATAYITELQSGVLSNEYGFYSLTVPAGDYTLQISYVGFESQDIPIALKENQKLNIELGLASSIIDEVVVTAEAADKNVSELEMSVNKMDIQTIKKMPSLLGEIEILRSIQLLPGVSSVGEGASGFNVRGGSIDQNLVLLDEAPVFNSSHLFGFFSVFNPDAVKDVKLYKGGIPARYGGRLSSILDVRMKEGNSKSLAINGGVGLIFSRLSVEAPIVKDKSSFIVAGRRSYIDVLAGPFLQDGLDGSVLNFYDLTLKTNYNLNEKNRFYLSGYFGRDNFGFGEQAGFNWGNSTGTLRWNHLFSDKLFSNVTLFYSDYKYQIAFGDDSANRFDWDASIDNYSVKPEFTYFVNPENIIRFGGQIIGYTFDPGRAMGVSEGETTDISLDSKYAIESSVFVENEQELGDNISLNYGLRYSHFNYTGAGRAYEFGDAPLGERRPVASVSEPFGQWESIVSYGNFEPRFSMKYQLNSNNSFKLSYNRTTQYIHLISNTTASTPVDVWTPSTNNIKPQTADQVALGFFKNLKNNTYELTTEVYYKNMNNLVEYIDGADLILNEFLEGDLLAGDGRAYGLEFMLKKTKGKFYGWLSYTLAKTERQVEGINRGEWFPARFDQRHNLSITSFYDAGKRWTLSANFAFISGTPTTFPTSRFEQQGLVIPHNGNDVRNNVNIPVYHRLDLGATLKGKDRPGKKWKGEWVFSIYNVYSKRNPFSIFFRQNQKRIAPGQPTSTDAVQLSVIGNFIPSISYNFKFQ